jgi:hypothetical protein
MILDLDLNHIETKFRAPRYLEPVWLRGSVHVSCGFILQVVWLIAAHGFKHLGSTQSCVPNTGLVKATLPCFYRGCCSENAANNFPLPKKIN